MLKQLFTDFRSSKYSRSIPCAMPVLLLSALLVRAPAPARKAQESLGGCVKKCFERLKDLLFDDERATPIIPPRTSDRPTVIFDFNGFLTSKRFSLRRFDFMFYERAFCGEFLFNMTRNYELISVSDMHAAEGSFLINRIDPYGCIAYRLFVRDKTQVQPFHINRPLNKLVLLSTSKNEFNKSLQDNTLMLAPWRGNREHGVLGVLHFFNNLHYLKTDDFRKIFNFARGVLL